MPDNDDDSALFIDGDRVTMDDLTFREKRTMRDYIRALSPDNDPDNASEPDIVPAIITVWKNRTDPDFTLEQALDYKSGDMQAPPTSTKTRKS